MAYNDVSWLGNQVDFFFFFFFFGRAVQLAGS